MGANCGPALLFQIQPSVPLWIDFRGIRNVFMRECGSDEIEPSREATFVQQETPSATRWASRSRVELSAHHGSDGRGGSSVR